MAPGVLLNGNDEQHSTPSPNKPLLTANLPTAATSAVPNPDHSSLIAHLSTHYPNPSLTVHPSHTLSLLPTPIPTPTPTQALIHIRCTGLCGSDIHLWRTGRIGPLTVTHPCVLGHEACGRVLAVGADVTHLKAGDPVAIEPGVPCEICFLCRSGRYNLCEDVRFAGVCPNDGSVRRFMCHDARYCHRMPENMSWRRGALLEPLAVVMHAISECEGKVALGKGVAVCGAGPIGLIAAKASRASGAWPVVVSDVDEARLEFAREFVPGVRTWRVRGDRSAVENAEGIRALFGCKAGRNVEEGVKDERECLAPQVVLECTGVESSVATAAYTCRRGGMVMVVGVGKSKMNDLPFMHLSLAEIQLRFINRYRDMWPAAMNVLGAGNVMDLDQLVTHEFSLEKAVEAMQTCADRSSGGVKVHVVDDVEIEV